MLALASSRFRLLSRFPDQAASSFRKKPSASMRAC